MPESTDLVRLITEIRAAAEECGALIIDAVLDMEGSPVPVAAVDGSGFPDLIRHVRPRLFYLSVIPFDARTETLGALETDDETILERPRIKKLISKWLPRDEQPCRAVFGLMCDGVLHGIVEEADWLAEFTTEAEALVVVMQQAREERERKVEAEERKRLMPMIKQLMADPRFSGPKVGIAKRTTLAESLFPNLDRDDIRAIVERAESEHWLASAGR